jgi:hypothetical protein
MAKENEKVKRLLDFLFHSGLIGADKRRKPLNEINVDFLEKEEPDKA